MGIAWAALGHAGDAPRRSRDAPETPSGRSWAPRGVPRVSWGRFGVPRSVFQEGFGSTFASIVTSWRARFGKPTTRLAKKISISLSTQQASLMLLRSAKSCLTCLESSIYIYIHIHMYICIYAYVCVHVYMHLQAYTCVRAYMYSSVKMPRSGNVHWRW